MAVVCLPGIICCHCFPNWHAAQVSGCRILQAAAWRFCCASDIANTPVHIKPGLCKTPYGQENCAIRPIPFLVLSNFGLLHELSKIWLLKTLVVVLSPSDSYPKDIGRLFLGLRWTFTGHRVGSPSIPLRVMPLGC